MTEKKKSLFEIIVEICAIIACIATILMVPEFRRFLGLDSTKTSEATLPITPTILQNTSEPIPSILPTIMPTSILPIADSRDLAARTLGYGNLENLMAAFGIPSEVKTRIYVCPGEETWCLAVMEQQGKPDFYFQNVTNCNLDGKQANGLSGIQTGFYGNVRGFTVRPCNECIQPVELIQMRGWINKGGPVDAYGGWNVELREDTLLPMWWEGLGTRRIVQSDTDRIMTTGIWTIYTPFKGNCRESLGFSK